VPVVNLVVAGDKPPVREASNREVYGSFEKLVGADPRARVEEFDSLEESAAFSFDSQDCIILNCFSGREKSSDMHLTTIALDQ